jgi:hypothetical protein
MDATFGQDQFPALVVPVLSNWTASSSTILPRTAENSNTTQENGSLFVVYTLSGVCVAECPFN